LQHVLARVYGVL